MTEKRAAKRVLIVYAHPEPRSLNGSLRRFAEDHLRAAGHVVQISDLYALGFKATVDAADFPNHEPGTRLDVCAASARAFTEGAQPEDVAREQAKLLWADAVLFVFPLWWYSLPAILKGWVDRVYAYGFGYGVGEHSEARWGDRFGEGVLAGKRAMLVVTAGGWQSHYGPRGVNGSMDELLFPIHHGILFYPGFDVLPPFVVYRTDKVDEARYAEATAALSVRLDGLFTDAPIPFRAQNGGDYALPSLELRAEIAPGETGLRAHTRQPHEALR